MKLWLGPVVLFQLCAAVLALPTEAPLGTPEPSSGCGKPVGDQFPKGRVSHRTFLNTTDPFYLKPRRYRIFLPTSYDEKTPTPLMLMFHGFYDNSKSEASEDHAKIAAERYGFILVYPTGADDVPYDPNDWWNSWNSGGTNGTAGKYGKQFCTEDHSSYPCYASCARAGFCKSGEHRRADCGCSTCADDTGFIVTLLRELKENLCIDESRVHGSGMSMGAMFLYSVATHPEIAPQLASAIPVEGSFLLGFMQGPVTPMLLIDIHGYDDTVIPANVTNSWGKYSKGGCPNSAVGPYGCTVGSDGWMYHPVNEVLEQWTTMNGCPANGSSTVVETPFDGRTGWSCMAPFGKCAFPVLRCVHNLGHTWPFHLKEHPSVYGDMLWYFVKNLRRGQAPTSVTAEVIV